MPVLIPLAVASMVVGTGYSIYAGERANKAQKEANAAQQKQSDLAFARQRRDAIRTARMARAQAQVTSEDQKVSSSSSAEGGLGSIFSQMNSNLSFLDQNKVLADQGSAALGRMREWNYKASLGDKVASVGAMVYGNADDISAGAKKIFGGN